MRRFALASMLVLAPCLVLAQPDPYPPAEPPYVPPEAQLADEQPAGAGQWVYTQQYGWVWMPYGNAYAYVPPDGQGQPYAYVYYPSYGWRWVGAPWIWGYGAWPFFGAYGAARFAWYAHGWWRTPERWHFRPEPFRAGFAPPGFRSAPYRAGVVPPRALGPAPFHRGLAPGGVGPGPFRGGIPSRATGAAQHWGGWERSAPNGRTAGGSFSGGHFGGSAGHFGGSRAVAGGGGHLGGGRGGVGGGHGWRR